MNEYVYVFESGLKIYKNDTFFGFSLFILFLIFLNSSFVSSANATNLEKENYGQFISFSNKFLSNYYENNFNSNDKDGDGISNDEDNCQDLSNNDQKDSDFDGIGDMCDSTPYPIPDPEPVDTDSDGILDFDDNCPNTINPNQSDFDLDGIGDACDFVSGNNFVRNPPEITSITGQITISWSQTGEIAKSFDVIIDGHDTGLQYRTSSFMQTVDNGTCFIIQARYDDQLINSDEICFDPEPTFVSSTIESFDRFGILQLYPTSGRIFESHWDIGGSRIIHGQERDTIDPELKVTGRNPEVIIDGRGVATMKGQDKGEISNPRMYVYDEAREKSWKNTEITIYMMRVNEKQSLSYAGLNVNSRSEHQDYDLDLNNGQSYSGRFTYYGKTQFVKEVIHDNLYQNANTKTYPWSTSNGSMPFNQWIGLKLVTYDLPNGNVKLELYMDLTDGKNGGTWKKTNEFIDNGTWEDEIFSEPSTSIWIKNDGLGVAKYKNFSAREIMPPV